VSERFNPVGRAYPAFALFYQERRGLLASFIDVLHHSRRRQARRIVRQYRHSIASSDQRAAVSQRSNTVPTMAVDKRPFLTSFQLSLRGPSILVAILLAVFIILHILAGAILRDATPPTGAAPTQNESRASAYD